MRAELRQIATGFRIQARMDLIWVLRDLRSLGFYFFTSTVARLGDITGVLLIVERFGTLGEWTRPRAMFMLGYALLIGGLLDVFFNFNVLYISRRIGRGQMDHVLLQPRPIWVALLVEGYAPLAEFGGLIAAIILLALGASAVPRWDAAWFVLFVLSVLSSTAVVIGFAYTVGSLAFVAPRAAEEICSPAINIVNGLRGYPLDRAARAVRGALFTLAPVALVAWWPCRALLGMSPGWWPIAATPFAACVFCGLGAAAFCLGLRHYRRAGCSRYLSYGHRR
jgi:ABC-2 type transport system permease protein